MLSSKHIVSSKPPHDAKKLFIHINKINTDIIMNKKIPHKANISSKAQNDVNYKHDSRCKECSKRFSIVYDLQQSISCYGGSHLCWYSNTEYDYRSHE